MPNAVWTLPAQNVTPQRGPDSPNLVDSYVYRTGASEQRFAPGEIIHFRYPDPRDPYTGGLAPLRACYEQVALMSDRAACLQAPRCRSGQWPRRLAQPEAQRPARGIGCPPPLCPAGPCRCSEG